MAGRERESARQRLDLAGEELELARQRLQLAEDPSLRWRLNHEGAGGEAVCAISQEEMGALKRRALRQIGQCFSSVGGAPDLCGFRAPPTKSASTAPGCQSGAAVF